MRKNYFLSVTFLQLGEKELRIDLNMVRFFSNREKRQLFLRIPGSSMERQKTFCLTVATQP